MTEDRESRSEHDAKSVLLSWRKRLFYVITSTFLVLMAVPFIVSARVSISEGNWFLLGLHTFCLLLMLVVVLFRKIPFRAGSWIAVIALFIVAAYAVLNIGPVGSGRIWLFAFSMIVTLLFGLRAGIGSVLLNTAVLAAAGFLYSSGSLSWPETYGLSVRIWMVTSVTFVFLNALLVASIGLLVNSLEKQLMAEKSLRDRIDSARASLEESQEMLTQAIQGSAIPTFVIGSDGVITHWNDACAKVTGRDASFMVGTPESSLVFGRTIPNPAELVVCGNAGSVYDPGRGVELRSSTLVSGGLEGEIEIRSSSGSRVYFCTAAPLRDRTGKTVGAIQSFMDITERRRVENQLRQVQKMDAIGRLAGGVAHDFNNMLSVIIGHSDMILEKLAARSPYRNDVEEIRKAASRSASLTSQLLAFARKQDIEPEVLDMNKAISAMSSMLRRLIGEDVQLSLHLAEDLWPVCIDRSQVDQILTNLCVNARDAIHGVGAIHIETSNVTLDPEACISMPEAVPGDYLMISVTDTGRGMEADTLEHLFEPFYTTKIMGEGTGLGLSTVHGIIRQNDGHISVESRPGRGTTFRIYLPRCTASCIESAEVASESVCEGFGEVILVVEDEEVIRDLACRMLMSIGYKVYQAAFPHEAIRIASEPLNRIDMLLTDVVMPGMNGKELADKLKETIPELKVLFMSGYTADVLASRGVVAMGAAFLAKPFTMKQLAHKVRKVLEG